MNKELSEEQLSKVDHQIDHFNSIAEEYFNSRTGEKQVCLHDLLYKELFYGLELKEGTLDVLEPMCGYGEGKRIIDVYVKNETSYEGFDYSEVIVDLAKKKNPNANIYLSNVITFTSNKKYDIIILIGGLHHVPDHASTVVGNMAALLKEGGIFINVEPTYNNSLLGYACKKIYEKNKLFDADTERRFSFEELNSIYRENGLLIEKQLYGGLLSYLLWYNPDAFPALNKIGRTGMVEKVFRFDRKFMYKKLGCKWSVATFTVLKKAN